VHGILPNRVKGDTEITKQSSKLNDDWTSVPDNDFAADYFNLIGWNKAKPAPSKTAMRLCHYCASRNSEQLFDPVCDLITLQQRARSCDICSLLQDTLNRKGIRERQVVALRQDAAHVGLRNGPNLLSMYCEPGENIP
jgi:hypothetical protein